MMDIFLIITDKVRFFFITSQDVSCEYDRLSGQYLD